MRFGTQTDMRGIIAPSPDADRAVRYLVKYLTKSVAETYADPDTVNVEPERHIDRLHSELRFLPCSPGCANWLRYGIQPDHPGPGMRPGWCGSKAHDRENLGLGGRGVLVSRHGPAKLCPGTPPTGLLWSAKPWLRPASSPLRLNGSPLTCSPLTGVRGSSGPRQNLTCSSMPASSWLPSLNGNAGVHSTKPRRPPGSLWTDFRQPIGHRDQPVSTTSLGLPDHQPSLGLRTGGQG
jgi:hypothetical protein